MDVSASAVNLRPLVDTLGIRREGNDSGGDAAVCMGGRLSPPPSIQTYEGMVENEEGGAVWMAWSGEDRSRRRRVGEDATAWLTCGAGSTMAMMDQRDPNQRRQFDENGRQEWWWWQSMNNSTGIARRLITR